MTSITPIQIAEMPSDTSPIASLTVSVFLGMCMCGWAAYDLYCKAKQSEERVEELEHIFQESNLLQVTHSETLQEHEQRIREKKDYDDMEEVECGKYQAWKGSVVNENLALSILIWREKESTMQKNHQWMHWDGEQDGACTVRDFYLGNGSPDFQWKVGKTEFGFEAIVEETMINGWDSVIKMKITLNYISDDSVSEFINKKDAPFSYNTVLKHCIDTNCIGWEKTLVEFNAETSA